MALSAKRSIAIIGSTGFLGPYLVASLLDKCPHAYIICVNRKSTGEERTLSSLRGIRERSRLDEERLKFVTTDVTNLGSQCLGSMLAAIDGIIFNAWNPNWSLSLQKLMPLVGALKATIQMSLSSPRHPHIVFVSSVCAIGEWPRNHPEQATIPEAVTQDPSDAMAHGYGKSKWIGERMLSEACLGAGLRAAIVRPGQIGGPSSGKHGTWPVQGWIYSIIKASQNLNRWPTHVQSLDWIPVDVLADGIAAISLSADEAANMQVYNMVHTNPAPWNLLFTLLTKRLGIEMVEMDLPKWLRLIDPASFKLHGFLAAGGEGREYDMNFATDNASIHLPSMESTTMDQLEGWLRAWNLGPATRARL